MVSRLRRSDLSHPRSLTAFGVGCAVLIGAVSVFQISLAWAIVLAGAGFLAFIERPTLAGFTLVALAPITSGIAEGSLVPVLRPSEAVILGIGSLFLLLPLRPSVRWLGLDWVVGLYTLGSIAFAAFHVVRGEGAPANFAAIIAPIQFLLLYRVIGSTLVRAEHRAMAVRVLLLSSIPISILGVLQQLDIGETRELIVDLTRSDVFETWGYENYPRATSIFPSWHPFAGYLTVILVLGFARLAVGGRHRAETIGALAVAAAALALSQTFTAVFAVALSALIIMFRQRSLALAWWVILVGIAASAFFGSSLTGRIDQQWANDPDGGIVPQTIEYRIEVWADEYLPLVEQFWLTGYGAGLPPEVDWQHTESGLLTLVLRGGIVLVALAGAMLVVSHSSGQAVASARSDVDRAIGLAASALVIALIPMNLVWPYLTNSGMSQVFFVVLGLVRAAMEDLVPADDGSGAHPPPLDRFAMVQTESDSA